MVGCTPEPAPVPGAFETRGDKEVTINGEAVTSDMLEAVISHMPQKQREALMSDENQKKRFIESYINTELLYREAVQAKFFEEEQVQRNLAMANRHILGNMYLNKIGEDAVTDEAIQAKYDENKVKYGRPSTHIHHIMVKEKDVAAGLVEKINGGADFAAIARENDPRAMRNGGDLGWVGRAPIPELEKTLNEGPLNTALGPIESRMGFHIIKIEARRDKTPIEEVRDQLAQMVSTDARKDHQAKLKTDAKIEFAGEEKKEEPAGGSEDTPSDAPKKETH
jgi:peptidyl-prolyl cis-trans isomerase C